MLKLCHVTVFITIAMLLSIIVANVKGRNVDQSSNSQSPMQEDRLFGLNCHQCENMAGLKLDYCCKFKKMCCPADKQGYCPREAPCMKSGLLGMRDMCLFDEQCPGDSKCCASKFVKCCKMNGLSTPIVNPIFQPVETLGRAIESAPRNIEHQLTTIANDLNPLNLIRHNPFRGLLN